MSVRICCLSGLGTDGRVFRNLNPEGVDLVYIPWIDPVYRESLKDYAQRLFDVTNLPEDYSLLGVSFGGMVATEFAKIRKPKKLFLVSTITNSNQLPFKYRIARYFGLNKITPMPLFKSANFMTYYHFGIEKPADKELLNTILKETDPGFVRWALNAMLHWKNEVEPEGIRIHGSKDRILPMPAAPDFRIEGGGHFMIVSQGKQISDIIAKIVDERSNLSV